MMMGAPIILPVDLAPHLHVSLAGGGGLCADAMAIDGRLSPDLLCVENQRVSILLPIITLSFFRADGPQRRFNAIVKYP